MESPQKSPTATVESSPSISSDTMRSDPSANSRNRYKDVPTKLLDNAARMAIFAFEEFSHESDRKLLSLAQIRQLADLKTAATFAMVGIEKCT